MKFFSRKALVAGATAIAVSFAGVNVASAAPETRVLAVKTTNTATPSISSGSSEKDADGNGKSGLDSIKSWIGIVTAVIGALSAIYTFINKISK